MKILAVLMMTILGFLSTGYAESNQRTSELAIPEGKHPMSLQWISWDYFGEARIARTRNADEYSIVGIQRGNPRQPMRYQRSIIEGVDRMPVANSNSPADFVSIEGLIRRESRDRLTFVGKIQTRVAYLSSPQNQAAGQVCEREGQFHFERQEGRRYFRLVEAQSPCSIYTDYVDLFIR